jgi:phosphatidylserine decarboxylase precursor
MITRQQASALSMAVLLAAACGCTRAGAGRPRSAHQPIVEELAALLAARADLDEGLTRAISAAGVEGIDDLDAFYRYVDDLVTGIPVEREAVPKVLILHYIVGQAPGDALNHDGAFSDWMSGVARAWGEFLDSPASATGIGSFASRPDYRVEDYFAGPSGWLTFNQFFARQIRPGKRPIADPRDDTVIVSPADAVFMGAWPIEANATVIVKGAEWSIAELLDDSPYADAFNNGVYTHSFLNVPDYHRYHVPVGGIVKEVRNVHGRVYLDVIRNADGSLSSVRGDTFQFNQERGLVVIDSPAVGLVAVVPVGMSLISSVNLTPDVGAELRKGDEFGYFQFGGSDIVLLFQDRNVVLEARVGERYLQGQRIGHSE